MSDPKPSVSSLRPFIAAPHASRYFPARVHEESRQRIARSVERGDGPALLIGAAGTGKTMLLEVLAEQFRNTMTIVPLAGAQICTRRAFLQMVLFQIGLPYRGLDEGELRLSLLSYLRPEGAPARRLLLLVDEAESLPDRLLEELRVLTNIADVGQHLVSLVLVGTAILEERFADPKLEVFSQRISSRSYLGPLGREETLQYICAQAAAVGQDPSAVYSDDGLETMFAVTDGVPRLINQLGNQLFWMANETGYAPLDAEIVQQAWSELQQLPAPWDTGTAESTGESMHSAVEFGDLELEEPAEPYRGDLDDDLPVSIRMGISPSEAQPLSCSDAPIADTFAVTEDPLAKLGQFEQDDSSSPAWSDSGIDSANSSTYASTYPSAPVDATPTHNPFLEEFESEECVLDGYSEFGSQLLSSAPKVVNRYDTFFAEQLQQFENLEAPSITIESNTELKPALDDAVHALAESDNVQEIPGELLVVEDETAQLIEVVAGKQFRQLFSSLHSENAPSLGNH